MHELALATAIRDTAVRHAGGRSISAVRVRAGALRQVVPESLDFYFGIVSHGTGCDGARLELEVIPAVLRCEACGRTWQPETPSFRCPGCGVARVELLSGEVLEVESIDIEEEEVAECIEPR
jgi:hydrogenase nickel incorporation protein HypA/HybF